MLTKKIEKILDNFNLIDFFINENKKSILFSDCLNMKIGQKGIFPCEILELRDILSKEEIKCHNNLPLFSLSFAEKYLKNYSIFLEINLFSIEYKSEEIGCIFLLEKDNLSIKGILNRIIVNEPTVENGLNTVKSIINDLNYQVECIVSNTIPGIKANKKIIIKKSQSLFPDGNDTRPLELKNDIKFGPKKQLSKYQKGMKVKNRQKGLLFPQEYGIIDSVNGNKIKIIWNSKDKKEQIFDIDRDSTILDGLLEIV